MFQLIHQIKRELLVVLVATMPISELRGAIPLGISLGLSPLHSTIISILGNIAIVPFLLKILEPVMDYLEGRFLFSSAVGWLKKRTLARTRSTIRRYSLLGLFILVAIPIPTTGAWTGCIAASLLKIDYEDALIVISLGVLVSGLIVSTVSYQVFF